MPRLTARTISLSVRQEKLLNQEKNRCKIALDLKKRIAIVLLSACGWSNHKISENLGLTYLTVLKWCNPWHANQETLWVFEQGIETASKDSALLTQILAILGDARPTRLSLAQYQVIQSLVCCKPSD